MGNSLEQVRLKGADVCSQGGKGLRVEGREGLVSTIGYTLYNNNYITW